ncbi:10297_t:CDS:2 [Ambispora leptoticha]|uniref:10297_t:CDS:1 n=1 Tax=Ambispora leptoticha TaxID=144679 RepID=A0A9N8Z5E3_9GLOM|nr:10297_t:CDS:2 [Ambispora leptoticha]
MSSTNKTNTPKNNDNNTSQNLVKKHPILIINVILGEIGVKKLGIDINPILEVELRRDKISSDKPIRLFDLLLCLEDDIVIIQEKIDIVGYSNQERAEEADENTRAYL